MIYSVKTQPSHAQPPQVILDTIGGVLQGYEGCHLLSDHLDGNDVVYVQATSDGVAALGRLTCVEKVTPRARMD